MSDHSRLYFIRAGAVLWIANIQYFIAQVLVAGQWSHPFSLLHNTISDLGNTVCSQYRGGLVCSPAHSWMNASFIVVGVTITAGAVLLAQGEKRARATYAGFGLLALGGLGTILVGLFPENTISSLHVLGASLPFVGGNIALVILGLSLHLRRFGRMLTVLFGTIGLVFLGLFFTQTYVGLGIGGTERLAAYPQTIWMIGYGLYVLFRKHPRETI